MLDLGGGSGILALEFSTWYPNSTVCIFEQPHVVPVTIHTMTQYSDEQRATVISGDFLVDDIGSGYDIMVASGILEFAFDDLGVLIEKIAQALSHNGYLFVIGRYSEHEGYTENSILGLLSGYMGGMQAPPTKTSMEALMKQYGYVDTGTLNILSKKELGVAVTVWTHPQTSLTERDVETFNAQYPTLEVRRTTSFHDRFLILDRAEGYLVGASLKDAGKKSFAIAKLEDSSFVGLIAAALGE